MEHHQHTTPMQTENYTSSGIINETVKQLRFKAIDMRFYWVRDRCKQNQFLVYCPPGKYTWVTTTPSSIHPHTTRKKRHCMYTYKHHQNTHLAIWVHSSKGVLNNFLRIMESIQSEGNRNPYWSRWLTGMIIWTIQKYHTVEYCLLVNSNSDYGS